MTQSRRTAWPKAGAGGRSPVDLAWSQALAHPVRVEILRVLLEHEPGTPSGFAAALEVPLGVASHHVRRLRDLRLIRIARRTHRRGAVQHHYRLVDRDATAQALWRWGLMPEEGRRAPARRRPSRGWPARRCSASSPSCAARREREGVSRTALARRIGVSADYLGRIERGEADPRMSVLLALVAALDATLRELLAEADAPAAV